MHAYVRASPFVLDRASALLQTLLGAIAPPLAPMLPPAAPPPAPRQLWLDAATGYGWSQVVFCAAWFVLRIDVMLIVDQHPPGLTR